MLTAQQRVAGLSPDLVRRLQAVEHALQQGRVEAAERDVAAALAAAPKHPEVLRLFAVIQSLRGRPHEAIQALQQANAQRPTDAIIYNALAGVYERVNDFGRAREALQRACELGPDLAPCWFNYGWRLYVDGDIDAAVPVLQRAATLAPQDAQTRSLLADALNADGNPQAAALEYRRIIADLPGTGSGTAWWGLATLKPTPLTRDDVVTLRELVDDSATAENDRITLGFALAMALENQGEFVEAFARMNTAHALARRSEPYDAVAFRRRIDELLAAFMPAPAGTTEPQGGEVIFIVSLPRSGSTLTEQILAAHSNVQGGAELVDLPQTILDESARVQQPFPQWVRTHTPEQWRALGQRYLARTARWRRQHPRFTDKTPGNWLYVGAILAMLPQARIVVCRRDPLETCLACYRYMYRRHPYTHDFSDLAARWHDFDRAIQHWKTLYPGRVHEQIHEDLIAEPEAQIRELLGFCNLQFEESCLNFHASERRVTTPSAAQVREPLRQDTARAAKYGALLDPLRAALARAS